MSRFLPLLFVVAVAGSLPSVAPAQSGHLVRVEDPLYSTILRLQERGHLLQLNPTALPYSESDIERALQRDDGRQIDSYDAALLARVKARLSSLKVADGQGSVGVRLYPGIRATSHGRLDPLRYLPEADDRIFQNALLQLRFAVGRFSSALAVRHDLYYDRDPDGLDSALRWLSRTEDSYIRYESRYIGIELGRFSRHWGVWGRGSTILSSNPRSYDQIGFRIGRERLSIRAILGELDSITADGRYTGTAGDDSVGVGSERRFLAVHRLDWRPKPELQVYFFQSTLYSGSNSGLSLKYLNPFHSVIFALDSIPKNDENNGLVGMGFWFQHGSGSVHFQGVVDDVDVLNLDEPMSFAVTGSAAFTRVAPGLDISMGGEAVGSRTYNTHQVEGRYLYLLRGLATQFSDYVSLFLQADVHLEKLVNGLIISPRLDALFQGEADIRFEYPSTPSTIAAVLSGTVERTMRGAIRVAYDPAPWVFLRVDAGVNRMTNWEHRPGASRSKFIAVAEFGIRLAFDHGFSIDFP